MNEVERIAALEPLVEDMKNPTVQILTDYVEFLNSRIATAVSLALAIGLVIGFLATWVVLR